MLLGKTLVPSKELPRICDASCDRVQSEPVARGMAVTKTKAQVTLDKARGFPYQPAEWLDDSQAYPQEARRQDASCDGQATGKVLGEIVR